MHIRKWQYFIVAAEEQHFGRAAKRLHISQPALSQQIQELERELGVLLFDRLPRGVRLSDAGEVFLAEATHAVNRVNDAVNRTQRAARGELGMLRIAYNEGCAHLDIVGKSINLFAQYFPNVALDFHSLDSYEQLDALRRDAIDLGFHHTPASDNGNDWMETVLLETHHMVLAIRTDHALAKKKRISVEDIRPHTFISSSPRNRNYPVRIQRELWFASIGLVPSKIIETESEPAVVNLVSAGLGIGSVLSSRPASDFVVYREFPGTPMKLNAILGWRRERESPQLLDFVRVVRESIA